MCIQDRSKAWGPIAYTPLLGRDLWTVRLMLGHERTAYCRSFGATDQPKYAPNRFVIVKTLTVTVTASSIQP